MVFFKEKDSIKMGDWVQAWIQVKTALSEASQLFSEVLRILTEGVRTWQPALKKLALVMCGGGLGAASRYGIGLLSVKLWGIHFPWGTMTVNLVGCFFIGLIFALADRTRLLTPDMRLMIITGYLGALTTFSAFSLETVNAGRAGLTLQPVVNILINNLGGMALTFLGLWLGGSR